MLSQVNHGSGVCAQSAQFGSGRTLSHPCPSVLEVATTTGPCCRNWEMLLVCGRVLSLTLLPRAVLMTQSSGCDILFLLGAPTSAPELCAWKIRTPDENGGANHTGMCSRAIYWVCTSV